jgi:hypothetical protein
MLTADVVWFVTITVAQLLVVPTIQVPRLMLVGLIVTGRMAVPEAFRTSGFTLVLFFTAIAPLIDPVVDGLNLTVNTHVADGSKVVMQPDAL